LVDVFKAGNPIVLKAWDPMVFALLAFNADIRVHLHVTMELVLMGVQFKS